MAQSVPPSHRVVVKIGPWEIRRPVMIFAGCWLMLLLMGWLDYVTGYELGFFVFYSAPIGLAAWFLGRRPGIAVALGATITWWLADSFSGARYSSMFSFWWNSVIHFLSFVINAVTIAKIKQDIVQRDRLLIELESARRAVREAVRHIPNCPQCGKPHARLDRDIGTLREMARNNDALNEAFCADCAEPDTTKSTERPESGRQPQSG